MSIIGRKGSRVLQQLRQYAAQAELAPANDSAFLRFGSPFAAQLNMNQALAQLPETKVSPSSEFLLLTLWLTLPNTIHN